MEDGYVEPLGGYLGLPEIKTDEVKKNFHSPSQRREAYLDLYATDHPCPSWNQVALVLRHGAGLRSQADTIEKAYIQGKTSARVKSCTCTCIVTT